MSKRIYIAAALIISTLAFFATRVAIASRSPRAQAADQAFSLMFMSDAQFLWWRAGTDPDCSSQDCQNQKGESTNQNMIDAMLGVQNLGAWPANLTFGANSAIIRPQGVIINGDLTSYWHKNEAELYRQYYPEGALPLALYTIYPGLGNHDYSNNVHGQVDLDQIYQDLSNGKDIPGSIYDAIYFPDYNRSAKEAVWYMAALDEHIPNLVNKDVTGYIKVENAGGFTARYTLEYNLPDGHHSDQSDEFAIADSRSLVIPSLAEGIHITIEENTGVLDSSFHWIWKAAGVFDSGRPRAFHYKISGTTGSPQVEELPAEDERPTGSSGSLAYSFDIGKYHFVQLQFRPNYEVDLPACDTLAGFESPGFKVTSSYAWLTQDLAQASAAGKYVVVNMHDFNISANDTDDPNFLADFKSVIKGGNVVAIFAGHIHQDYGNIGSLNVDGSDIPIFRSGSAECLKFLLAEFHERYFNVAVVNAAGGQPAYVQSGDVCDARVEFQDTSYSGNGGDPVARTYVINRKPVNLSATMNTSPAREGSNLSFSASASDPDGDALTYTWNFGDGTTGSGQNPTHAYADNGTYSVSVTVDDGYTGTANTSLQVTVINVDPQVNITNSTQNGTEGSQITLQSNVTDPGSVDTTQGFSYAWTVTKNNGVTPFASGTGSTLVFTPDDDGSYLIGLTVTDKDGGSGTDHISLDIRNAIPSASITDAPATSPEGTPITLGSTVTDPGSLDTAHGFTRSWTVTKNGNGFATGTGTNLSFTPDDNGTYVVSFAATDKDGGTGKDTKTINVTNVAPAVSITGAPTNSTEGTQITIGSTVTDPGSIDSAHGFTYSWAITKNNAPFASGTGSTLSFTPDDNGAYVASFSATDKDGGTGHATQTISVANVAPVAALNSVAPVNEGSSVNISFGSAADPSTIDTAAGFHYSFAGSAAGLASSYTSAGAANSASLTFPDNGTYIIYGRIFDKDGGATDSQTSIIVNNIAPAIQDINISPVGAVVEVNSPITASAAFSDPGALDTHTALWDWNVGGDTPDTANGTVRESAGSGSVTNTHSYAAAGVYPLKLTVTDKDGGSSSSNLEYVVVYDPHEGFVMGRGWFDSPAGAVVSQPRLSGPVHFGFMARYHKRAEVPKGETHFHFRVGDFRFESRNYEWLMAQGALAQYEGTAKVNGRGGYTFLLTAFDGQAPGGDNVDRIRLKVWNTVTGAIVYDNMMGRPTTPALNNVETIGSGRIAVHDVSSAR